MARKANGQEPRAHTTNHPCSRRMTAGDASPTRRGALSSHSVLATVAGTSTRTTSRLPRPLCRTLRCQYTAGRHLPARFLCSEERFIAGPDTSFRSKQFADEQTLVQDHANNSEWCFSFSEVWSYLTTCGSEVLQRLSHARHGVACRSPYWGVASSSLALPTTHSSSPQLTPVLASKAATRDILQLALLIEGHISVPSLTESILDSWTSRSCWNAYGPGH